MTTSPCRSCWRWNGYRRWSGRLFCCTTCSGLLSRRSLRPSGAIPRPAAQLASRARTHVREARPRFQVAKQRGLELAEAFFAASRSGNMKALGAMLAADVSAHADGGGKRPAAMKPIVGFAAVMKFYEGLAALFRKHGSTLVRTGYVNGLPGFITREADGELQTTALDVEDDKIAAIYVVRNPDKLRHLH
jgi:RNA polymerase sigma-70 factor, ECF subfamily